MIKIKAAAPVLLVRNVIESANYFKDKLGFSYDKFWGVPPDFCMVQRDGHTIMLSQAPTDADIVPHWYIVKNMWNAYFWVEDVEALYAEFQRNGAKIDYHLEVKHYGVKEFGIQDLDGHDIAFGELLKI